MPAAHNLSASPGWIANALAMSWQMQGGKALAPYRSFAFWVYLLQLGSSRRGRQHGVCANISFGARRFTDSRMRNLSFELLFLSCSTPPEPIFKKSSVSVKVHFYR